MAYRDGILFDEKADEDYEHDLAVRRINTAVKDSDVAMELSKYIPLALYTAKALKAERKLMHDPSDKSLNWLTKAFDLDHKNAGTKYAIKMMLRNFRSETF